MNRERLEDLANSNFETQRFTRQDIRDILAMLDKAELRAKAGDTVRVDQITADRSRDRAVAVVGDARRQVMQLLESVDRLSETLDTRALAR